LDLRLRGLFVLLPELNPRLARFDRTLRDFDVVAGHDARRCRSRFQTPIGRFVSRQLRFGFQPLRANAVQAGRRLDALRLGRADPGFGLASLRVEFGRAQTGEQLALLYNRAAVDVYLLDEALNLRVNGRVLPCLQLAGEPNLAVEFERSHGRDDDRG